MNRLIIFKKFIWTFSEASCQKANCATIRSLRKIPEFYLISRCVNFVERNNFPIVFGKSPETPWKLCFSTKSPHQELLCSGFSTIFSKHLYSPLTCPLDWNIDVCWRVSLKTFEYLKRNVSQGKKLQGSYIFNNIKEVYAYEFPYWIIISNYKKIVLIDSISSHFLTATYWYMSNN